MKAYNLETALENPGSVNALFIRNRRMRRLPSELGQFSSLRTLGLSHNELEEFELDLPGIEELDLSYNQFTSLPEGVRRLRDLRVLKMNGNFLTALPEWIGELRALEVLEFADNSLESLPAFMGRLFRLEAWDFSGNQLRKLPSDLSALQKLKKADLSHNRLRRLPVAFQRLPEMRELYLQGNRIKGLPSDEACWPKLEKLDWSANGLTQIPEALGACRMLQQFFIRKNKLEQLPAFICQFSLLRHLDLGQNRLTDGAIRGLKADTLLSLSLDENLLERLPEGISSMNRLLALDLRKNNLAYLPEWLGAVRSLEKLFLDGNPLRELPGSLGKLPRLKKLSVKGHALPELPGFFFAFPALEKLTGVRRGSSLLRFAEGCKKEQIPVPWRKALWRLVYENEDQAMGVEEAFAGLRHPFPKVRKACLVFLSSLKTEPLKKEPGMHIAFLGSFPANLSQWERQLDKLGLSYGHTVLPHTRWIVLGNRPIYQTILEEKKRRFLSVSGFAQWLRQEDPGFLEGPKGEAQQKKLARLLRSGQPENVQLALTFLESGGVPEALHTDLYLAMQQLPQGTVRRRLRKLLKLHLPPSDQGLLAARPTLKKPADRAAYFHTLLAGSNLDARRIIQFWESRD